jgi:hypothetical protein
VKDFSGLTPVGDIGPGNLTRRGCPVSSGSRMFEVSEADVSDDEACSSGDTLEFILSRFSSCGNASIVSSARFLAHSFAVWLRCSFGGVGFSLRDRRYVGITMHRSNVHCPCLSYPE